MNAVITDLGNYMSKIFETYYFSFPEIGNFICQNFGFRKCGCVLSGEVHVLLLPSSFLFSQGRGLS